MPSCARRPQAKTIFSLWTDQGEIIANPRFVEPFLWREDLRLDTVRVESRTISLPGSRKPFTIRLYTLEGFENEPGYFCVVDIECDGRLLLRIKELDAWNRFPERFRAGDDCFRIACLDERTYVLLLAGYPYPSEAQLLTIVVWQEGRATLVYNRHGEIDELWDRPLRMRLITDYLEAIWKDDSLPVYAKVWFGNGRLGSGRIR